MTSLIINPADVPNGDQIAGSSSFKCNENCEGCLCEKHPCRIIEIYFAKKRVETVDGQENQYRVYFDAIDSANPQSDNQNNVLDYDAMLGKTVYLIIETEHMPQQPIRLEIQCAELGENALEMMWFNGTSYAIGTHFEARVGNFDALNNNSGSHAHYTNLCDYEQYAIVKLQLRPNTRETFNSWVETIDGGSVNFQVQSERVNGDCIYEDEQEESSEPHSFLTGTDRQFRVVNRNFYVIYHSSNEYNFLPPRRENNAQVRKRISKIESYYLDTQSQRADASDRVVYFYYDTYDNEHLVISDTIKNRILEKGSRTYTIPDEQARGVLLETIDYRDNQNAGENINASILERYEHGTLAIQYGIRNHRVIETIVRRAWYPNTGQYVYLVNTDIERLPGMGGQLFTALNYQSTDGRLTITYSFEDTRRRSANPDLFAAFIGALAELYLNLATCGARVSSEGFAYEDGSCYPSTMHRNGNSVDTHYFSQKGQHESYQQPFINYLHAFGIETHYVGCGMRYTNTTQDCGRFGGIHGNHLHSASLNRNILHEII